jgi:uncharacterized membrane protein
MDQPALPSQSVLEDNVTLISNTWTKIWSGTQTEPHQVRRTEKITFTRDVTLILMSSLHVILLFCFFMWVISEVLHTVCFLFKNEFILQNTFTGLQCNLHRALSQWSNVWESLVFLSGRLRFLCV